MGKIIQTSILITITTLFSLPAFAESKFTIMTKCMSAVDARDKPQAMSQANVILGWENIFSNELKINGAACLTFAMDKKHIYDHLTNRFVSGELVENAVSVEDQPILLAQLNKDQNILKNRIARINIDIGEQLNDLNKIDERLQNINLMIISKEIHSSCSKLYLKNKEATSINPTCVEAFKKLGHPLLDTYKDAPLLEQTKKELNRLTVLKSDLKVQLDSVQEKINSIE